MTRLASYSRVIALAATLLTGCASTSPAPAFQEVSQTVKQRGAAGVRWDQNTAEDEQAAKAIEDLLARELTVDAAVQIALLGSPRLRSTFEELSIAQADLVQAGLLKNPVFTIGSTAWDSEHIDPNLFLAVEQDFLDLITLPMRKRVAATQLEVTKLEVGDEMLRLSAEVRSAFYVAQAAEQTTAMQRMVSEAAETSAELARRQHAAGNTNDLALSSELALASQARLALARTEGEAAVAREHLTKLMGIWGKRTGFKIAPRLPELPAAEVPLDRLESLAIEKRLDIGAARREVQSLEYATTLAKTTRWTGFVNVSVEAGRLRSTKKISLGPAVSLEIPLFDQRQGAIARLEAFRRQAENNLQALSVDARSDVRASHARVTTARRVVAEYGKSLVPIRENIVKLSQQQYDAMLLGVYQLIQAKQSEFEAYREYIQALRDYWIARSDLERAVGARLGASTGTQPPSDSNPKSPTPPPSSGGGHTH
jgi:cobalt-zinc-cadmium efflux system outer membrane protein